MTKCILLLTILFCLACNNGHDLELGVARGHAFILDKTTGDLWCALLEDVGKTEREYGGNIIYLGNVYTAMAESPQPLEDSISNYQPPDVFND